MYMKASGILLSLAAIGLLLPVAAFFL